MIYGLYQSAAGVIANSYRQDVIANNLANAETTGFKKDLAEFQQRRTEAEERGSDRFTNKLLEGLGGGLFARPTHLDTSQGDIEPSSNNLDTALEGNGYYAVRDHGVTRLTRDGRFSINRNSQLVLANSDGQVVLNDKNEPITLQLNVGPNQTTIGKGGEITQNGKYMGRIGVFDVADPEKLRKLGGNLLSADETETQASTATVHGNATERANVEPATELIQLMDAQRQLEANANMIRFQDSMLQHACNEIGKLS